MEENDLAPIIVCFVLNYDNKKISKENIEIRILSKNISRNYYKI